MTTKEKLMNTLAGLIITLALVITTIVICTTYLQMERQQHEKETEIWVDP